LPHTKNATWLRTSGTCGILAPILAFAFIFSAIASYSQFSWVDNALSDLGVVPGATAVLFNSGLIISGVLCFVFATGLFVFLGERAVGRVGAFVLGAATLALVAIGVFPESVRPVHYMVSVAFFVLLPISLLIITGAFWFKGQVRMAVFTLLVAIAAVAPWVLLFSVRYVSGVAVPEFVSALAGAVWAIVLGYKMIKEASRAKVP
jgi:hypothetical membrane protein